MTAREHWNEDRVAELVDRRTQAVLHEIRQPLAAVFALAEMARSLPGTSEDARACIDRIIEQVEEACVAASSVAELPLVGSTPAAPVDIHGVLASVVDSFRLTWSGTLVWGRSCAGVLVEGDRALIRRCLVNIIDNAVRAAGPSGHVVVSVRAGADEVRVVVEDDGPGFGCVPTHTGLGLALTRRALESFGGRLSTGLRSAAGGARVALALPTASRSGPTLDEPVRAG